MELIGAAPGGDVDLPCGAAELRRINAALHLELLQRIHGREHYIRVEIDVSVLGAIKRKAVVHAALAGERDVLSRTRAALPCAGLA